MPIRVNSPAGYSILPDKMPGRVLLLDGDPLCYHAACTVKTIKTGLSKMRQDILTKLYLAGADYARVHITAGTSDKAARGRVLAARPYQGNRNTKTKPPLLEPLREAISASSGLPEADVFLHYELEADDGLVIDSYAMKDKGVVASDDKDLRQTIYPWFDGSVFKVDGGADPGWIGFKDSERTGQRKLIGRGMEFFWAQMLMGDYVDNVLGLASYKGSTVGPVKAHSILEGMSVDMMADTVIKAYKEIDQNVIAEGWLLFMLRSPDDNVLKYFKEIDITPEARAYVKDCKGRKWFE